MSPTNSKDYRSKNNNENYKKYQKPRVEYRSKLNSANHKLWNYGNHDNKDLQHINDNPKDFSPGNLRTWSMVANRRKGAAKANGTERKTTFSWHE